MNHVAVFSVAITLFFQIAILIRVEVIARVVFALWIKRALSSRHL